MNLRACLIATGIAVASLPSAACASMASALGVRELDGTAWGVSGFKNGRQTVVSVPKYAAQ
jgi:hypothetical protein